MYRDLRQNRPRVSCRHDRELRSAGRRDRQTPGRGDRRTRRRSPSGGAEELQRQTTDPLAEPVVHVRGRCKYTAQLLNHPFSHGGQFGRLAVENLLNDMAQKGGSSWSPCPTRMGACSCSAALAIRTPSPRPVRGDAAPHRPGQLSTSARVECWHDLRMVAMSLEQFEELVADALDGIPAELGAAMETSRSWWTITARLDDCSACIRVSR